MIVPISICYNHDSPRLTATPMIRQGDSLRPHIKDRRVLPQVSAAYTGAIRSVVIHPATRGHAKAMPPGSGDLDVVGALRIADPPGRGRRIALAILNAPPTDRDKSKCNNVPRLSGNRLARPGMPTLIRVPYLPQLYCGDRDSSGTRCTIQF